MRWINIGKGVDILANDHQYTNKDYVDLLLDEYYNSMPNVNGPAPTPQQRADMAYYDSVAKAHVESDATQAYIAEQLANGVPMGKIVV